MELDVDEYFAEIAVQEANVWRRRRVHLPSDFEESLAEEDEDRTILIESGYLGPFRMTWGDRLRLSVREEAVWAAIEVFQRRERERVQQWEEEESALRLAYFVRGISVSRWSLAAGSLWDARAVFDEEYAAQQRNIAEQGQSEEVGVPFEDDWEVS